MEEIDIIQNIIIAVLSAVSIWLGVKPGKQKVSPLDELEFHNRKLEELLKTEKGKKCLVDYVVYELALQGEIADLVETIKTTESDVHTVQINYPSNKTNIDEAAKKEAWLKKSRERYLVKLMVL